MNSKMRMMMDLSEMKPCAFCLWGAHAFPNDAEHNALHAQGWHTCAIDGVFRQSCPECKDFAIARGSLCCS